MSLICFQVDNRLPFGSTGVLAVKLCDSDDLIRDLSLKSCPMPQKQTARQALLAHLDLS